MKTAIVEGKTVKIGDVVGFKCDVEQYATITEIHSDGYLTLENKNGFDGEYVGSSTVIKEHVSYCWVD